MNLRRNPFYLMAGFYLLLDAIALSAQALVLGGVLPPLPDLGWARIHLLTIGVVVQAILGTLPTLVATKLGGKRPSISVTWTLWLLVNSSFGLLLYSMPDGFSELAAGAAIGIFAAVVLLLATLHWQGACSVRNTYVGLRFYMAAPLFFLFGIVMAMSMLLNWPAPGQFFGLLEAHVHANVWGFLALIVAGFLLEHIPAYANRPLRWSTLVPATFWFLTVGAAGLVAGPWLGLLPVTMLGIVIYVIGTSLLLSNLIGTLLPSHSLTPNIAHLVIAYLWMMVPAFVAPIILALTGHLPTGRIEEAAVSGLVAGWILQIVIGAFPLRLREVQQRSTGHDGWWLSVVILNVGVLSVWISAFVPAFTSSLSLMALGYTCVVIGCLLPLTTILKRLLGNRQMSVADASNNG